MPIQLNSLFAMFKIVGYKAMSIVAKRDRNIYF